MLQRAIKNRVLAICARQILRRQVDLPGATFSD